MDIDPVDINKLTKRIGEICKIILTEKTMMNPIILVHRFDKIKITEFPFKVIEEDTYLDHQVFPDISNLDVSGKNKIIFERIKDCFHVTYENFTLKCKSSSIYFQLNETDSEEYKYLLGNKFNLNPMPAHKLSNMFTLDRMIFYIKENYSNILIRYNKPESYESAEQYMETDGFYKDLWYSINITLNVKFDKFTRDFYINSDNLISYILYDPIRTIRIAYNINNEEMEEKEYIFNDVYLNMNNYRKYRMVLPTVII